MTNYGLGRLLGAGVLFSLFAATPAYAFSSAQTTSAPAPPVVTTPNPARAVTLDQVTTQPFTLPNGSSVDLTQELGTMLLTAVTNTASLVPTVSDASTTATAPSGCSSYVELRASLTSVELNATQLGVTIGYTPTIGDLGGVVTGGNASLNVSVSEIGMDFSLWECSNGQCQSIAAASADQSMTDTNLNFTIDFSAITTAAQLVNDTPLGDTLQAIIAAGISQLAASPRIADLPWSATVMEVNSSAGTFIFNQGSDSRLATNQSFVVYAGIPGEGACAVYQAVAYATSTEVDPVSSVGTITQSLDSSRGVEVGDVVMIEPVSGGSQ
jgi:hypothetical protein